MHSKIGRTPFELVLSRAPPSLNIELSAPADKLSYRAHEVQWLRPLQHLVDETIPSSSKARARYKRSFDTRLRKTRHHPREVPAPLEMHPAPQDLSSAPIDAYSPTREKMEDTH
eukprot:IDg9174t1